MHLFVLSKLFRNFVFETLNYCVIISADISKANTTYCLSSRLLNFNTTQDVNCYIINKFIYTSNNYVFVCAMWGSYFHRNSLHSAHILLTLKFRL